MRSMVEGEERMRLASDGSGKRQAKRLRREMSLPELLLWRELRHQQVRWRKGHPAGPYTLDFFCAPARLAVEVDGEAHDRGDRPARDARRDAWMDAQGVLTLRVPATEVLRNLDGVINHIREAASGRMTRT